MSIHPAPPAFARPRYEVRLLDAGLNVVAILGAYRSLKYVKKRNLPGGFELVGAALAGQAAQVQRLRWLQVWRNGALDFAGRVLYRDYKLASDGGQKSWELTASGPSPDYILARRLAGYNVAGAGWGTFATASDVRTGAADDILKDYVRYNAGALCPVVKYRVPWLTVAANVSAAAGATYEARLETLQEVAQRFCPVRGLDYALVPNAAGTSFAFTTFAPQLGLDRTQGNSAGRAPVVFSPETGTAGAFEAWEDGLAVANDYVVGGSGSGVGRLFANVVNEGSVATWERSVAFLDAQTAGLSGAVTPPQLQEQGGAALAEHADGIIGVKFAIVPLAGVRYEVDWDLGDVVTVAAADIGLTLADAVHEVAVTLSQEQGDGPQEQVAIVTGRPHRSLFNRLLYAQRATSQGGRR